MICATSGARRRIAACVDGGSGCPDCIAIPREHELCGLERGEERLFDEIRYFFYLTKNSDTPAAAIVFLANDRCNQENLIAQLQRVGATRMPVDTLLSNWAYLVARPRIEPAFGWLQTVAWMRKVKLRGLAKVDWLLVFASAAYSLMRLPSCCRNPHDTGDVSTLAPRPVP